MQGVYAIKDATGKVYIGSSTNIESRWNLHKSTLASGKHFNSNLLDHYKSNGAAAFEYVILEKVNDKKNLRTREDHWIKVHDSTDANKGYNRQGAAPADPFKKPRGVKVEGEGPKLRGEGSNYPLAETIREVIRQSGLPQNVVAERAKVDKGVINRLLKGTRDINGATIDQLFRVFGAKVVFENPQGDV